VFNSAYMRYQQDSCTKIEGFGGGQFNYASEMC